MKNLGKLKVLILLLLLTSACSRVPYYAVEIRDEAGGRIYLDASDQISYGVEGTFWFVNEHNDTIRVPINDKKLK